MSIWVKHQALERNSILLVIGILLVIAIGGIVEITPLFYLKSTIEKVEGVRPYTPLELAGRNIYVREGCYLCHSQMIRTLRDEVERYGHYSLAAESMFDHPFQWIEANRSDLVARRRQRFDEWYVTTRQSALDRVPVDHAGARVPRRHRARLHDIAGHLKTIAIAVHSAAGGPR
jgi:cytochrome c oxidase cbb3-type subunit 2